MQAAVLLPIIALLQLSGALQPLANALSTARFEAVRRPASGEVALVTIDARSLAALGTWPWSRAIHAELVDRLTAMKAQEIAFDVDFSARSTEEGDAAFEAALARADGSVILAAFRQVGIGEDGAARVLETQPLARFAAQSWQATVGVHPDADGLVRHARTGEPFASGMLPSIPALFARVEQPGRDVLIDFSIRADQIDQISAIDVLQGRVDPARVAGKRVIVGATAVELRDFFAVPTYGLISGPMLQALAAESLIQGRDLRPGGPVPAMVALFVVALGVAALRHRFNWKLVLVALAVIAVAAEGVALAVQVGRPIVPDTAPLQCGLAGLAVLAVLREIDLRRLLLLASRRETRELRIILDQVIADSTAGVVVVDGMERVLAVSQAAVMMLGGHAPPAQTSGLRMQDLALPQPFAIALRECLRGARPGDMRQTDVQETSWTGGSCGARVFAFSVTPSYLAAASGQAAGAVVACLTFEDVTERRTIQERLFRLAHFDSLTALPNRNSFHERLSSAAGAGATLAVMYFDLDRFKSVNDSLGHHAGDTLLAAAGERARRCVGPDDLLSRLSGDEFAVLLMGADLAERATSVAESLIRDLGRPYSIGNAQAKVGVSVGIAIGGSDGNPDALLQNADAALYRSKQTGGSRVTLFDAALDASVAARQVLEQDLWIAFEREEFDVHYQPQVELASGRVTGAEALVRWRSPTRGQVSPVEFIPAAERTGLIDALGAWVLGRACRDAAAWPQPLKVAVNLSGSQFQCGDLARTVADALGESGLAPERLDLEITESVIMENGGGASEMLAAFRALGIRVSLDDFGTGYSSLSYIQRFPIDKIKVDKSFVDNLPQSRSSAAIIRAVVSLAESLDIRVNVEGVETPEQHAFARMLGCHEGQGYLFGKPLPNRQFVEMIEPLLERGGRLHG